MLHLALETSSTTGSVALFEGDRLLDQSMLNPQQRSAQSLAPTIADLLHRGAKQPTDIGLISLATGPGSFTGLRVGVTTAKALAYAVGAKVLGVNTLEVIAAQAPDSVRSVWAAIDAQRDELFVARYERDSAGQLIASEPTHIVGTYTWIASLTAGETVTGPAIEKLGPRTPAHLRLLAEQYWRPTAAMVGHLAWLKFAQGERQDLLALVPNYFRRTAAEEQWERQAKSRQGN